jgi:hypothetical protein
MSIVERAAEAIANERGGRRGMPPITNVLDLLPDNLREEVMQDAQAVLEAIGLAELLDVVQAARGVIEEAIYSEDGCVEVGQWVLNQIDAQLQKHNRASRVS